MEFLFGGFQITGILSKVQLYIRCWAVELSRSLLKTIWCIAVFSEQRKYICMLGGVICDSHYYFVVVVVRFVCLIMRGSLLTSRVAHTTIPTFCTILLASSATGCAGRLHVLWKQTDEHVEPTDRTFPQNRIHAILLPGVRNEVSLLSSFVVFRRRYLVMGSVRLVSYRRKTSSLGYCQYNTYSAIHQLPDSLVVLLG